MALSSNPEEAHISPRALYPKRASEQVSSSLQFTLLLDTGSSGGWRTFLGARDRALQQGHLMGHLIAFRCLVQCLTLQTRGLLHSHSKTESYGGTIWAAFPSSFCSVVRKESSFPFRKDGKPLSQALLSSRRGKFPQPLDQAWLFWGWGCLTGVAPGLAACAPGTGDILPAQPQGILPRSFTGETEGWVQVAHMKKTWLKTVLHGFGKDFSFPFKINKQFSQIKHHKHINCFT